MMAEKGMTGRYLHDAIRDGDDLRATCLNWKCYSSRRLDLVGLEAKLGHFYSADLNAIADRLCCPKCGCKHVKVEQVNKKPAAPPVVSLGYIVPPK